MYKHLYDHIGDWMLKVSIFKTKLPSASHVCAVSCSVIASLIDRPSRILHSENGNSVVKKCKFRTQMMQIPWLKLKILCLKIEILHSEKASFALKNCSN